MWELEIKNKKYKSFIGEVLLESNPGKEGGGFYGNVLINQREVEGGQRPIRQYKYAAPSNDGQGHISPLDKGTINDIINKLEEKINDGSKLKKETNDGSELKEKTNKDIFMFTLYFTGSKEHRVLVVHQNKTLILDSENKRYGSDYFNEDIISDNEMYMPVVQQLFATGGCHSNTLVNAGIIDKLINDNENIDGIKNYIKSSKYKESYGEGAKYLINKYKGKDKVDLGTEQVLCGLEKDAKQNECDKKIIEKQIELRKQDDKSKSKTLNKCVNEVIFDIYSQEDSTTKIAEEDKDKIFSDIVSCCNCNYDNENFESELQKIVEKYRGIYRQTQPAASGYFVTKENKRKKEKKEKEESSCCIVVSLLLCLLLNINNCYSSSKSFNGLITNLSNIFRRRDRVQENTQEEVDLNEMFNRNTKRQYFFGMSYLCTFENILSLDDIDRSRWLNDFETRVLAASRGFPDKEKRKLLEELYEEPNLVDELYNDAVKMSYRNKDWRTEENKELFYNNFERLKRRLLYFEEL